MTVLAATTVKMAGALHEERIYMPLVVVLLFEKRRYLASCHKQTRRGLVPVNFGLSPRLSQDMMPRFPGAEASKAQT